MELKPIKEKSEALYPTIKEVPKSSFIKEMFMAANISELPVIYVAVPSYLDNVPIKICSLIRWIFSIVAILSSILLVVNKIKINKCKNEDETSEKLTKLNKHRKIKWWILGISIAIIVITFLVIWCIENYM